MKLLKNRIAFCMIAMFSLTVIVFNVLFGTGFVIYSKNVRLSYNEKTVELFNKKLNAAYEHSQTVFDLLMTKEYKSDFSNNLLLQSEEKQSRAVGIIKRDLGLLSDPCFYIDAVYVIGRDTNQLSYAYYTDSGELDKSFSGIDTNDLLSSGLISTVYRFNKKIGYIGASDASEAVRKYLARDISEEKSAAVEKIVGDISDSLIISSYLDSQFVLLTLNKEKIFGSVFPKGSSAAFMLTDENGNTVYTNIKNPGKGEKTADVGAVKGFELLLSNKKLLTHQYILTLIITLLILLPLFIAAAYKISRWIMLPVVRVTDELASKDRKKITKGNYGSLSVKRRILLPTITVFLSSYLVLSLSGFCCAYILNGNQNRQMAEIDKSIIKYNIEKNLYEPTQIVPISYDEICRMVQQKDVYNMPEPYLMLKSGNENASKLDYFFITDKKGELIYSSDRFDLNEINIMSYYAIPFVEKSDGNLLFLCADTADGKASFWVKKAVGNDGSYGCFFMKPRNEVFDSLLQNLQMSEITVFDENNGIIYQSAAYEAEASDYSEGDVIRIKGEMYTVHPIAFDEFNMNILYMQPKYIANKTLYRFINYFFIIVFIGLSAILIAVIIFSDYISKNIYRLIDCMNAGERCTEILPSGENEIHFLIDTYNQMLERIDLLTKKTVIQEKHKENLLYLKTQAELISLRHQVNSHFIFNVLNIIHEDAVRNGNSIIANTVKSLASMIRYSMMPEMLTTISNELEIVDKYVFIQKTRFNSCFEYHTEIEEEVENVSVLRLMIQPLVENAIEHGLFNMSCGNVYLSIFRLEEMLCICVTDDGIGMYERQVDELMEYITASEDEAVKINADHHYGIALRNIYQRIKSYYGACAELKFETAFMSGTTVKLLIPVNKEAKSEGGAENEKNN